MNLLRISEGFFMANLCLQRYNRFNFSPMSQIKIFPMQIQPRDVFQPTVNHIESKYQAFISLLTL